MTTAAAVVVVGSSVALVFPFIYSIEIETFFFRFCYFLRKLCIYYFIVVVVAVIIVVVCHFVVVFRSPFETLKIISEHLNDV